MEAPDILDEVDDAEFLDVGSERRPGLSWRVRLTLLAVGLTVVGAALVVDRGLREREGSAVAGCATDVAAAVDLAGRRVRATYEYVRPSLVDASPELQQGVQRLMAEAADGAETRLVAPRETCAGVTVFPLHDALQERRDRCVAVLDAQRAGLVALAQDGSTLGDWLDTPRSC